MTLREAPSVRAVGWAGTTCRSTTTSVLRNEGMRRAVREAADVVLAQEVYADWSRDKALEQARWLWQRHPQALREQLTHEEIDASRDALARFVGVDAYQCAGGGVRRDLFADDQTGVFLADPALLEALTADIHGAFRACLQAPIDHDRLDNWRDLSRLVEQRMLDIYDQDAAARAFIAARASG